MIRAAAQQQEPVAIVDAVVPHLESIVVKHIFDAPFPKVGDFFYTSPPPRKPLTDEEKTAIKLANSSMGVFCINYNLNGMLADADAKLREKNA